MEKKQYESLETMHGVYQTTLTKKHLARKPWTKPNPKEVRSFIPGTVVELCVKIGQEVKEGDMLMVYKAMKMNNNIRAAFDGKIKEIMVKEGDNLPNRTPMIMFE